nr:hypothetical protein [uncultured Dyadobacter sp.]
MSKKMICGIVVALAFMFSWLIFRDSAIQTDDFLLRAVRFLGFGFLAVDGGQHANNDPDSAFHRTNFVLEPIL